MQYCANDVLGTHEVLVELLPLFLSRCPHPVTFTGMLEMGSAYIPLNSSWKQYTGRIVITYDLIFTEHREVTAPCGSWQVKVALGVHGM